VAATDAAAAAVLAAVAEVVAPKPAAAAAAAAAVPVAAATPAAAATAAAGLLHLPTVQLPSALLSAFSLPAAPFCPFSSSACAAPQLQPKLPCGSASWISAFCHALLVEVQTALSETPSKLL
jgi:hypothetical protein